jgi:hypothetical protein
MFLFKIYVATAKKITLEDNPVFPYALVYWKIMLTAVQAPYAQVIN